MGNFERAHGAGDDRFAIIEKQHVPQMIGLCHHGELGEFGTAFGGCDFSGRAVEFHSERITTPAFLTTAHRDPISGKPRAPFTNRVLGKR